MTERPDPTPQTHHVLHISAVALLATRSTGKYGTIDEFDGLDWSIGCPSTTGFEGWQECTGDHAGFDVDDEDSPAYDLDGEIEIHGVLHEHNYVGWTVPFEGCVVSENDALSDYVYDIAKVYGPGDYLIEDDWDEYEMNISALCMVDGSPLPEPGWFDRNAVVAEY